MRVRLGVPNGYGRMGVKRENGSGRVAARKGRPKVQRPELH